MAFWLPLVLPHLSALAAGLDLLFATLAGTSLQVVSSLFLPSLEKPVVYLAIYLLCIWNHDVMCPMESPASDAVQDYSTEITGELKLYRSEMISR